MGREHQQTLEQRKQRGGRSWKAWKEGSLRSTETPEELQVWEEPGAETGGLRGRRSKGEGAGGDQRRLEDRVHFRIKYGGLPGVALREGVGKARDFLERQPGALKDGKVDTTLAEGTWLNTKKQRFCSQRNRMGSLPTDQKRKQGMLEQSF